MKLAIFVTIASCIHFISCAPTKSAIDATNGEINYAKHSSASESISNENTILLKSIKHIFDQIVQTSPVKRLQTAPSQPLDQPSGSMKMLTSIIKKLNEDSKIKDEKIDQLKECIKKLQEAVDTLKKEKLSESSGYPLANGQNQHVVPNGNGHIVIEVIDQQPTNPDTYIQPLYNHEFAASAQPNLGTSGFVRSYNFVRRN